MSDLLVNYTQEFLEKKEESKLRTILHKGFDITKGISKLSKQELIDLILTSRKEAIQKLTEENKNVHPTLIYKSSEGTEFKAEFQPETKEFDECVILTDVDGEQAYETLEDFNENYIQTRYSGFSPKDESKPEILSEEDVEPLEKVKEIVDKVDVEEVSEPQSDVVRKSLKNKKAAINAHSKIHKEMMQRFGYLTEDEDGYLEDLPQIKKAVDKEFKSVYGFDSLKQAKDSFIEEEVAKKETPKKSLKGSKSSRVIEIVKNLEKKGEEYTSGTVMKKLKELHGEDIHRSFCITLINRAKNQ